MGFFILYRTTLDWVSNFHFFFISFLCLLATKPIVKWFRASDQSSGGVWVEKRANAWFFFSFKFFKIVQFFSQFIPINFISFKVTVAFIQKLLMYLSFPQTGEPHYFPELEFLNLRNLKGLKSCQTRTWSSSEGSNDKMEPYLSLQSHFLHSKRSPMVPHFYYYAIGH